MRYKILLFSALSLSLHTLHAQKANKVFAITGDNTAGTPYQWTNISEVDAGTGRALRPVYSHLKTAFEMYDGVTKTKLFSSSAEANQRQAIPQMPVSFLVAAAAYDVRHNRMFISPMQQPELRWIDLDDKSSAVKIYSIQLPLNTNDLLTEPGQITRMTIAADGYGYALTNDAKHLIRFSTGKNKEVTDLGALQDDESNGKISVHTRGISFGGDMISDADGNLYLLSAYQAVFKIDVAGRTATFISSIKNLPTGYTCNGAAVNADGDLIVSSAVPVTGGYYKVDMNNWEAVKISGDAPAESVSDLASSYYAFQKKQPSIAAAIANVAVYPNPVVTSAFQVKFTDKEKGAYTIQLMDASGRVTLQRRVNLIAGTQAETINMPPSFSKGLYTVQVVKTNGKQVYSKQLLVN